MPAATALDTFAAERLPPAGQLPEFLLDLPELQYPERVNCAKPLLDDALSEGHADRVAVTGVTEQWTYAELAQRANQIAHVLVADCGVQPGNRVLLRGPNNPMLVAGWLAVMKVGGIAVTTMPMLRKVELEKMVLKARIQYALCDARFTDALTQVAGSTGYLQRCVNYGNGELESLMRKYPGSFGNCDTARDDVALLAFTSGTTGEPKATIHFHRDVLAMTDVVARHLLGTRPDDVYAGTPSLGFTFGLGALLAFPLRFRAASALMESHSPEALLTQIERSGATCLFTAPTAYKAMLSRLSAARLGTLRQCVSAGEHLPKSTSDAWYEATGIRIIDGLGSTEMIHMFIAASGTAIRPGATGKVLPGYRACILDDSGKALPPGAEGRLAVKGPTGCRYLDDPRQQSYVQNGWNLTGDVYVMDEDGYFWFQSRTDDMIVSSGYNISPVEVELALLQHPSVLECAVVSAPDPDRGNIVKAYVVLRTPTSDETGSVSILQEFVKRSIAPYKYPRSIEFIPSLPRTATGKVQRNELRQQAHRSVAADRATQFQPPPGGLKQS
jgi:2-aminobenzoate-CoA ligase